jgi:hypothetical protein
MMRQVYYLYIPTRIFVENVDLKFERWELVPREVTLVSGSLLAYPRA